MKNYWGGGKPATYGFLSWVHWPIFSWTPRRTAPAPSALLVVPVLLVSIALLAGLPHLLLLLYIFYIRGELGRSFFLFLQKKNYSGVTVKKIDFQN